MDKNEAIQAMKRGEKVSHKWFYPEEYVFMPDNRVDIYQFEDGVLISEEEFWSIRKEGFEDDWYIIQK